MTILQIAITFSIGLFTTILFCLAVFAIVQMSKAEAMPQQLKIAILSFCSVLLIYLVGLISVNALGGYSGLSTLIK